MNKMNEIEIRDGRMLAQNRSRKYYYMNDVLIQPYDNTEYLKLNKILNDLKNKFNK